ncbi:MAG: PAS domain-containing protein, partial [bacterium]
MIFSQKLINSLDMGICLLDKNLRILIWNSWLEDRTGRMKVELVNKNIGELYPIFNKKIYQEYFSKLLSEVNNSVFLAGVLHPDFFNMSQERNFRYNTTFRSFNYNGTEHIIIQVNDVTSNSNQIKALKEEISKRKKTANELKEKNIQLEELNKKLDREIAKAEIIHQTVLQKKLPLIEGFSLSAYYNPAVSLGGDFYKVIIKGNKAIIYLSDVTGHGLDSAFLSSFIKNTVDSYIAIHEEEFISPQKIAYFLQQRITGEVFPDD